MTMIRLFLGVALVASLIASGWYQVWPWQRHQSTTTTQTVTSTTTATSTTSTQTGAKKQSLPVCDTFTAVPASSGSTLLTWGTTNATKVTISDLVGTLPVDGTTTTKPTVTTTYQLTAFNSSGASVSCSATATVVSAPDLSFCDSVATTSAGTLCAVAPSKTDARTLDNTLPTGSATLSKQQDAHYGFGYHAIAIPKDWANIKGTWIHFTGSYGRPYDQNSKEATSLEKFDTSLWLNELMSQGYIVIQLAYDNRFSVNGDLCIASTSVKSPATGYYVDNCAGKVREMGLTGTGDGAGVRKDDAYNTIDYRLQALLTYVGTKQVTFPEKFDPVNFDWSKVSVSGHSQGAAQAYYVAQKRQVEKVCMMAGIYDRVDAVNTSTNTQNNVADWILNSVGVSKTPTSLQQAIMTKTDASYSSFYNADSLVLKLPATQLIVVPAATYYNSAGTVIDGHGATIADPSLASYRAQACFGQ